MDYETVKFDFQNIGKVIELTGGRGDRGGGSKNTFSYQVFHKKKKSNSIQILSVYLFGLDLPVQRCQLNIRMAKKCVVWRKGKRTIFLVKYICIDVLFFYYTFGWRPSSRAKPNNFKVDI